MAFADDECNDFVDAGNAWSTANALPLPTSCGGETNRLVDHEDWYHVNVPLPGALGADLTVTLCPGAAKNGPWNPDLEVYHQVAGGVLQKFVGPGDLAGASANAAGCDTVVSSLALTDVPAFGRWYVHVHRTAGDGFYGLVLA